MKDLLKDIINKYQTKDFYPNDYMTKEYVEVFRTSDKGVDLYFTPNPRICALSKYDPLTHVPDGDIAEDFSIEFVDKEIDQGRASSDFRKSMKKVILSRSLEIPFLYSDNLCFPKDFNKNLEEHYINPQKVANIAYAIEDNKDIVPIPSEEYRSPIIKKKKEIYNRFPDPFSKVILHIMEIKRRATFKRFLERIDDFLEDNREDVKDREELYNLTINIVRDGYREAIEERKKEIEDSEELAQTTYETPSEEEKSELKENKSGRRRYEINEFPDFIASGETFQKGDPEEFEDFHAIYLNIVTDLSFRGSTVEVTEESLFKSMDIVASARNIRLFKRLFPKLISGIISSRTVESTSLLEDFDIFGNE